METVTCPNCGCVFEVKDEDVCLMPYPHCQCENCGEMIPLF